MVTYPTIEEHFIAKDPINYLHKNSMYLSLTVCGTKYYFGQKQSILLDTHYKYCKWRPTNELEKTILKSCLQENSTMLKIAAFQSKVISVGTVLHYIKG